MSGHERLTAYFSGYVQGVGFRFTAVASARAHPEITGFIRNLPDGRVHLVAEGSPPALDAFLHDIRNAMRSYIRDVDMHRSPAQGAFSTFTVKH